MAIEFDFSGQIQAELFNIRIPQHDNKFIPFFFLYLFPAVGYQKHINMWQMEIFIPRLQED